MTRLETPDSSWAPLIDVQTFQRLLRGQAVLGMNAVDRAGFCGTINSFDFSAFSNVKLYEHYVLVVPLEPLDVV